MNGRPRYFDSVGRISKRAAVAVTVAWFVVVGAGFVALAVYKLTPAEEDGAVAVVWPRGTLVQPSGDRATLLLFAHPRCACTRASIAELAGLMARSHDRLAAYVLFTVPSGSGDDFARTDLWSSAQRIPGVRVLRDDGGAEAARFGMATSGAVALYDPRGKLVFHGGITPARGHEGDSFGRRRIASILATGAADRTDAPVFGCALRDEEPVRMAHMTTEPGRGYQ